MNELRSLLTTPDLDRHVVRLHLDMTVSLSEESEVERILRDLRGTDATHGRVGVLVEDSGEPAVTSRFRGRFSGRPPASAERHRRAARPAHRGCHGRIREIEGYQGAGASL